MGKIKSNLSFVIATAVGALSLIFFLLEYYGMGNLYDFMIDGWSVGSIWWMLPAIGAIASLVVAILVLVVGVIGLVKVLTGNEVSDSLKKNAKSLIALAAVCSIVMLAFIILLGIMPDFAVFSLGAGVIISTIIGVGGYIADKVLVK